MPEKRFCNIFRPRYVLTKDVVTYIELGKIVTSAGYPVIAAALPYVDLEHLVFSVSCIILDVPVAGSFPADAFEKCSYLLHHFHIRRNYSGCIVADSRRTVFLENDVAHVHHLDLVVCAYIGMKIINTGILTRHHVLDDHMIVISGCIYLLQSLIELFTVVYEENFMEPFERMLVVFDAVRRLERYREVKTEFVIITGLRRMDECRSIIKSVLVTQSIEVFFQDHLVHGILPGISNDELIFQLVSVSNYKSYIVIRASDQKQLILTVF